MKKFEKPSVEVIAFNVEDIITTSGGEPELPAMIGDCIAVGG